MNKDQEIIRLNKKVAHLEDDVVSQRNALAQHIREFEAELDWWDKVIDKHINNKEGKNVKA